MGGDLADFGDFGVESGCDSRDSGDLGLILVVHLVISVIRGLILVLISMTWAGLWFWFW